MAPWLICIRRSHKNQLAHPRQPGQQPHCWNFPFHALSKLPFLPSLQRKIKTSQWHNLKPVPPRHPVWLQAMSLWQSSHHYNKVAVISTLTPIMHLKKKVKEMVDTQALTSNLTLLNSPALPQTPFPQASRLCKSTAPSPGVQLSLLSISTLLLECVLLLCI